MQRLPMLAFSGLVACSGSYQTEFQLFNDGTTPIHIWITGQQIDKQNKVEPGDGRTETIKEPEAGSFNYTVYAGSDGTTLDEFNWTVTFDEACRLQVHEIEGSWNGAFLETGLRLDAERECD